MKKLLVILFLSFASCNQSTTEDKIKEAIEKNVRQESEKIEYLKVDSIHYSLGTLAMFYLNLAISKNKYLQETRSLRQSTLEYPDYSLRVKLSHEINFIAAKEQLFSKLSENLDTSIKVYNVDYYINFKSPKYSYEGHEATYLYANNLTPVKIDFDSLFTANNVKEDKYDSTDEIRALQMNDNLELELTKLQRELGLLIAGGYNRVVISEQELRIARLKVQISGNKVKYFWLY